MSWLLLEAETILEEAESAGLDAALLGGLAVRAWAGTLARETLDIDLAVASAEQADALGLLLERRGYRVLDDPAWRRAVRSGPEGRVVVDWTGPDVVDPKTLATYRLSGRRTRRRLHRRAAAVVGAADLIILKLLGCRDQDVADLALLAALPDRPSVAELLSDAGAGGAADRVAAQAMRLLTALHSGEAAEAVVRVIGRGLRPQELEPLDRLVLELVEEGEG